MPLRGATLEWLVQAAGMQGSLVSQRDDLDGFKNVLKLRAEIEGQWGGTPPDPGKYIDLSYYDKAVAGA